MGLDGVDRRQALVAELGKQHLQQPLDEALGFSHARKALRELVRLVKLGQEGRVHEVFGSWR